MMSVRVKEWRKKEYCLIKKDRNARRSEDIVDSRNKENRTKEVNQSRRKQEEEREKLLV